MLLNNSRYSLPLVIALATFTWAIGADAGQRSNAAQQAQCQEYGAFENAYGEWVPCEAGMMTAVPTEVEPEAVFDEAPDMEQRYSNEADEYDGYDDESSSGESLDKDGEEGEGASDSW